MREPKTREASKEGKIAARSWLGLLPLPQRVFVLLGMVLAFLVVAFFLFLLCADLIGGTVIFFPSLHTKEVAVEIGDGWVRVEPATIGRTNYVTFKVTNLGSETHMFVVVDTDFVPDDLPIENSQVRSMTYTEEPQHMTWMIGATGGGSQAREAPPGEPLPPPIPPAEGPMVAPGQTIIVERVGWWNEPLPGGTIWVLFCNCPGHYERGEYTILTIR